MANKAPHDLRKIGDYVGMGADAQRNDSDRSFAVSRQLLSTLDQVAPAPVVVQAGVIVIPKRTAGGTEGSITIDANGRVTAFRDAT